MKLKKLYLCLLALTGTSLLAACSNKPEKVMADVNLPLEKIIANAKQEGAIVSVGMPDTWANWKDTWADLNEIYGLEHQDTDMSSAEEIAKIQAEGVNGSVDIGDVGFSFKDVVLEKDITLPYKPTTFASIPDWAKDPNGHWMLAYTGTMAFIINISVVKNPPTSWADLAEGDYQISLGDVGKSSQANNGVLAAAFALGGDESNLEPAFTFFAKLAKQKRLSSLDPNLANLESGEVVVGINWDFNALHYKEIIEKNSGKTGVFKVIIPSDGAVINGYTTIINKNAPHPYSAMLAREYILSDAGQINLAKGKARPIRDDVELPEDVKANLIPIEQYVNARPIANFKVWNATAKSLSSNWAEKVLINR